MMRCRNERGMALVFVLSLLVTLGLVAAEVARSARSEAALVAGVRARSVGRYAAESGIAAAMVRIHALLDSVPAGPDQPAAFRRLDSAFAQIDAGPGGTSRSRVTVVNLNARLDLNRTNQAVLREFLSQFTSRSRADDALAALKKEPIRRVGELARVPGMDQALAFAIAPYVTVWSDGLIDINAAPEPVLAAVPGIGAATARSLVQRREEGEVFTSTDPTRPRREPSGEPDEMGSAAPSQPFSQLVTTPTRLLLISRGWQEGHPLTHEIQAAYMILGHRLVLQAWWERDL
jgi:DNA uptake protein ComE-like DNA-binding protein